VGGRRVKVGFGWAVKAARSRNRARYERKRAGNREHMPTEAF